MWADFPDGKRFRSSGVSIAAKAGAPITGRGLLADGGRYEDEYVKTPSGWRFKSRKYTPPATATASGAGRPAPVAAATAPTPTVDATTVAASTTTSAPKIWTGVYSAAQAKRGEGQFQKDCLTCHGFDLQGLAGRGPALSGAAFMTNWETESVATLFSKLKTTMPRNNPGSLTEDVYLDLLAFMLKSNNYPEGAADVKTAGLAEPVLREEGRVRQEGDAELRDGRDGRLPGAGRQPVGADRYDRAAVRQG